MYMFRVVYFTSTCVFSVLAFKIFDGTPLLEGSQDTQMHEQELREVIQVEPNEEYTTMSFQFERDAYLGEYARPRERCNNDHVRCLTTILSPSRPVCGTNRYDNVKLEFGSLCDIYLANCKMQEAYYTVIDNGNCTRAEQILNMNIKEIDVTTIVYNFTTENPDNTTVADEESLEPNLTYL